MMSNEALTRLVSFVQAEMATSIAEMEDERIQIRVDDFDFNVFNQVLDFTEECLLQEQPTKRFKTGNESL